MSDEFTTRVSSVEDDLRNVALKVGGLESDVKNVTTAVNNMSDSMRHLTQKISSQYQTNWGVLGSWAAVLLTAVGAMGYMSMQPINDSVSELKFKQYAHFQKEGHIGLTKEIEALRREIGLSDNRMEKDIERILRWQDFQGKNSISEKSSF